MNDEGRLYSAPANFNSDGLHDTNGPRGMTRVGEPLPTALQLALASTRSLDERELRVLLEVVGLRYARLYADDRAERAA
jgi:hypothetical protein